MVIEWILISLFKILVAIGIFAVLVYVCKYIVSEYRFPSRLKDSKISDPLEYFPSEELLILKQVFYLVMILVIVIICLYLLFDWDEGFYFIYILDIVVSLYLAINLRKDSKKEKVLSFLLIPFGSIIGVVFGHSILVLLDLFHIADL